MSTQALSPPLADQLSQPPGVVSSDHASAMTRFVRACAIAILSVGLLTLAGWWLRQPWLVRLGTDHGVAPNTALAFLLSGIALMLTMPVPHLKGGQARTVGLVCAAVVALIAILTLAEYLLPIELPINRLLAGDPSRWSETSRPPRMAPVTSALWILGAIALAASHAGGRATRTVQPLAVLILLVALLGVFGYAFGDEGLQAVWWFRGLSLPTALGFGVLAIGLVSLRPAEGLARVLLGTGSSSVFLRRLVPWIVLVPSTLGWLSLQGQAAGYYGTEFGHALMAVATTATLLTVLLAAAARAHPIERALQFTVSQLGQARDDLIELNATLEEQVQERTAVLETANAELETFASSVSHDLRAPLRAIEGFSRILVEEHADKLSQEGRNHLQRVRMASQQMAELVDALLKLSRSARGDLELEQLDLSDIAREVVVKLHAASPGRNVKVSIEPGVQAVGDAHLVRIALENLLSNAWKYTSKTAGARIAFSAQRSAATVTCLVEDNGVGFDMANAGKLFKPFQRLHSAAEFPGSGIGLATVRRVISRQCGRVWAHAEVGGGARFHFTLPTTNWRECSWPTSRSRW